MVVWCRKEEKKKWESWKNSGTATYTPQTAIFRIDKLLKLVVQNEEQLMKLLSAEEQRAFQKFKDTQDELSSVNECKSFTLGFRLGARFMLEIMENIDIPFIDE